jgi:hypothetical protein
VFAVRTFWNSNPFGNLTTSLSSYFSGGSKQQAWQPYSLGPGRSGAKMILTKQI